MHCMRLSVKPRSSTQIWWPFVSFHLCRTYAYLILQHFITFEGMSSLGWIPYCEFISHRRTVGSQFFNAVGPLWIVPQVSTCQDLQSNGGCMHGLDFSHSPRWCTHSHTEQYRGLIGRFVFADAARRGQGWKE